MNGCSPKWANLWCRRYRGMPRSQPGSSTIPGFPSKAGIRSGLSYAAAVLATTKVRHVRKDDPKPARVSVEALALSLPKHAWRTITWREGTNEKLQSRFARVRVRAAPIRGEARFAEETLLIEWPEGEAKPTKYW